ncbi:MAG: NAD-dependent epimerase/dehydratase family protein [Fuerstiella sp.]|nr:NAD-dependent epimerase/dehydratase family protein [Fuerstiella sp.]MCP4783518.1 NAD-dependent epimerase/dehydratase family protein [Fuerstiella sp.]MCP4854448.1 NAD-dependent epimerase/dehydratase family protein [Fuerstiella sp.]
MLDNSKVYVLITGGAGFLGAHVVQSVLRDSRYDGLSLLVIDDLSGGFLENLPEDPRLEVRQISVVNAADVDGVFADFNIKYVFHLAAYAAEGLSHFIRRFNYQNNLIGSVNLINAAVTAAVEHFVFTSSIAVYGATQVPMTEDTVPSPEDPYGISKLAVELDLRAASAMFGLPFTIFRPHNVYGEFQNIGDRYRNVVGIFMNRIIQEQTLPIFGDGTQQRAFTYVADLMDPITSAPFVPAAAGQIFNIGASCPVSVHSLAELICREFDVPSSLEFLPARNEVHIAWSDHSRCKRVFGTAPDTTLADGVHRMAEWVRKAGPRASSNFGSIEIEKGLPPSWRN